MSKRAPHVAWLTGLFAVATAAGLISAVPAGAVAGNEVKEGESGFTVKLNIGDKRACSGVLIDPKWVLTATSCFSDGGQPVQAGKPTLRTTVTVNRTDLSQAAGSVVEAVTVNPRADRDVALVGLAWPIVGGSQIKLANTAPAVGEELKASGFGRTKTEWVPDKLHAAAFTVGATDGTSVQLNGSDSAVLCQGDAGGPAVRILDGKPELAAINSRSWQGGCLDSDATETRTEAVSSRVDDLKSWVTPFLAATSAVRPSLSGLIPDVTNVMAAGDFNNDGRTDVAVVLKNGNLHTFAARADGTFENGRQLWKGDGSWKSATKIIAGDFNGDGYTDIASVWADGRLRLYAGKSDGQLADGKLMWPDASDWNGMLQLARFKSDNSGRDGLLAVWGSGPAGSLYAYSTTAEGILSGTSKSMWGDPSWKNVAKLTTGDFNGDGRDDVVALSREGGLFRWDGNAQGGLNEFTSMWKDNTWGATQVLLSGDFDGDGRCDIGALWSNLQRFNLYKGNGAGALSASREAWPQG
ncbi:trypsin-like serine protease [Streptomyces sp. NPDC058961]|uniref:trypsin-like serine protease n=1 Tax=Streptomyces sp. NPDC058961 TaxID=3346680 RepID=UPI0036969683